MNFKIVNILLIIALLFTVGCDNYDNFNVIQEGKFRVIGAVYQPNLEMAFGDNVKLMIYPAGDSLIYIDDAKFGFTVGDSTIEVPVTIDINGPQTYDSVSIKFKTPDYRILYDNGIINSEELAIISDVYSQIDSSKSNQNKLFSEINTESKHQILDFLDTFSLSSYIYLTLHSSNGTSLIVRKRLLLRLNRFFDNSVEIKRNPTINNIEWLSVNNNDTTSISIFDINNEGSSLDTVNIEVEGEFYIKTELSKGFFSDNYVQNIFIQSSNLDENIFISNSDSLDLVTKLEFYQLTGINKLKIWVILNDLEKDKPIGTAVKVINIISKS